jgi:hypothetical protein
MLANVPSSQVVLSQLKFPAAWHSYFTASPSEDVVECLQVSSRFSSRTLSLLTRCAQATNKEFGPGAYRPYMLFVEHWNSHTQA